MGSKRNSERSRSNTWISFFCIIFHNSKSSLSRIFLPMSNSYDVMSYFYDMMNLDTVEWFLQIYAIRLASILKVCSGQWWSRQRFKSLYLTITWWYSSCNEIMFNIFVCVIFLKYIRGECCTTISYDAPWVVKHGGLFSEKWDLSFLRSVTSSVVIDFVGYNQLNLVYMYKRVNYRKYMIIIILLMDVSTVASDGMYAGKCFFYTED